MRGWEAVGRRHSPLTRLRRPLPSRGEAVPVPCATVAVSASGIDQGALASIPALARQPEPFRMLDADGRSARTRARLSSAELRDAVPLDALRPPARRARTAVATPGPRRRVGADDRPGSGSGWPGPGHAARRLDFPVVPRSDHAVHARSRADRDVRLLPRPVLAGRSSTQRRLPDPDRDRRPDPARRRRGHGLRAPAPAARRRRPRSATAPPRRATSWKALNFAGVFKAQTVIFVQNNQWAISVPRARQTASETLAQKALAPGRYRACWSTATMRWRSTRSATGRSSARARARVRSLVEALTYRLGAHTTADDPRRYQPDGRDRRVAHSAIRCRACGGISNAAGSGTRCRANEPPATRSWRASTRRRAAPRRCPLPTLRELRRGGPWPSLSSVMVQAVNRALAQALAADERVVVMGQDVGQLGGVFRATDGLQAQFRRKARVRYAAGRIGHRRHRVRHGADWPAARGRDPVHGLSVQVRRSA